METKIAQYMRQQVLTTRQHELIIGSLLGDEYIAKTTSGYAFRVNHGLAQKAYADWKYNILRNLVVSAPQESGRCYYFRTVTHPAFLFFRKCFYEGNKKILAKKLLDDHLNPFIVAIWIMDDGAKDGSQLRINSQSFTQEENQLLQEILRAKLGIESTLNRDKDKLRLRIKAESMSRLVELIKPYFIPSMLYKLPL